MKSFFVSCFVAFGAIVFLSGCSTIDVNAALENGKYIRYPERIGVEVNNQYRDLALVVRVEILKWMPHDPLLYPYGTPLYQKEPCYGVVDRYSPMRGSLGQSVFAAQPRGLHDDEFIVIHVAFVDAKGMTVGEDEYEFHPGTGLYYEARTSWTPFPQQCR